MNDWDNRSTEVAASREVLSGREDQQEAASDSPLPAFGSPLSPAGEVGHSNHEPAESEETIGTTSNHPFWSVDRQQFVQAGSLEIGERLQTLSGDVKVVQQKLPRPGPQPVFNLEVHYEHVYFVGQDGVLVHNAKEYVDRYHAAKGTNTEPDAQIHHSYPQRYRKTAEANGYDIDSPDVTFAVRTTPSRVTPNANPHQKLMTNGFMEWHKKVVARFGTEPTHQQILQKKSQMDRKYGRFYDRHLK